MKVLLLNGSPHERGCTYTALDQVAQALTEEGLETEILREETTGIWLMEKYLFSWSRAAVVPARRALTTAAWRRRSSGWAGTPPPAAPAAGPAASWASASTTTWSTWPRRRP